MVGRRERATVRLTAAADARLLASIVTISRHRGECRKSLLIKQPPPAREIAGLLRNNSKDKVANVSLSSATFWWGFGGRRERHRFSAFLEGQKNRESRVFFYPSKNQKGAQQELVARELHPM